MSSDRRNPLLRYFSWFLKIIYPPHAIAFILQSGNVLKAIAQTVARSLAFCPANRDKAESMYNQHSADIRALQWHAPLFFKLFGNTQKVSHARNISDGLLPGAALSPIQMEISHHGYTGIFLVGQRKGVIAWVNNC